MAYDPKSCNALEKPYYRPIEAAIRWCKLTDKEPEIFGAMVPTDLQPSRSQFPMWPCLFANMDRLMDAIRHGELPGGRDGITVADPSGVAKHRLTIRHADLKKWMIENDVNPEPPFLFGGDSEIDLADKPLGTTERNTLLTIIAALCKEAKLDHTKHAKTAGLIQSTAAGMGVSIGETTIEGHLKKIPDALTTRMK